MSLVLISNICYADDAIYLEKDKPAPFNGFLSTEGKTREIRIKLLERDTFENINQSLTKTNTFLQENSDSKDKQIKIVMDRDNQLAQSLRDERSTNNWERIGWFAGGILTTILTIYGVKEATK